MLALAVAYEIQCRLTAVVPVMAKGFNHAIRHPRAQEGHAHLFGDLNQYGEDSIRFFTRTKVVTQRWPHGGQASDQSFVLPTMK
jgi:hypothetical protein